MNGSYHRPVHPDNIIDLRPKAQRIKTAWFDLTAVRIVRYLLRLIISLFVMIGRVIYDFFTVKKAKRIKAEVIKAKEEFEEETKLLVEPDRKKHSFTFKAINFFAVLCLLAVPFLAYSGWKALAPVRYSIAQKTNNAFAGLFNAKDLLEQKDFNGAEKAFEDAGNNFLSAQENLRSINQTLLELAGVIPNDNFKLASESKRILNAGKISAKLGAELTAALSPAPDANALTALERFNAHAIPASEEAEALLHELNKIKVENLPAEYRDKFSSLRQQAVLLNPGLKEAVDLAQKSSIFLGKNHDKRYLLVFQNNSEKRASGGFLGSFALVDIKKGEISNLTVPKGGSYDTEAGLYRRVVAPEPLWLVNPLWHFWDANWWPDWPTTAKKLEWFYEKSDGPTVDGVISLTPTVIEKLLAVHGPVDMTKDYGVIINSENFWQVTQTFSEQKPNVTKEPKKIIGDLMTKLMEDLPKNMDQAKLLSLISVFESSLNEKHILLYFNDPELEEITKNFGWEGSVRQTDRDYLMVVSSNIGGQKSDRAIKETIDHSAEILPDSSIVVTLKVRREHTAPKNQEFVGFRNVDWLRIYVPKGSRLISASGFRQPEQSYFDSPDPSWEIDPDLQNEREAKTDPASGTKIYEESGKTVFANWTMIDPGETADIELRYELPFRFEKKQTNNWLDAIKNYFTPETNFRYGLLVQKQPGSLGSVLNTKLKINGSWKDIWHYPANVAIDQNGISANGVLDTDFFFNILFDKQ